MVQCSRRSGTTVTIREEEEEVERRKRRRAEEEEEEREEGRGRGGEEVLQVLMDQALRETLLAHSRAAMGAKRSRSAGTNSHINDES